MRRYNFLISSFLYTPSSKVLGFDGPFDFMLPEKMQRIFRRDFISFKNFEEPEDIDI